MSSTCRPTSKKSFINNNMNYAVNQNIDDPKNKIVLIYNHASNEYFMSQRALTNKNKTTIII